MRRLNIIDLSTVFPTLGKSRRLRWKESLLTSKIAKLESGLLKTREDIARPSSKSRNFTDACVPHLTLGTRGFSRVRRKFSVLAEGRHIFGRRPKPRAAKTGNHARRVSCTQGSPILQAAVNFRNFAVLYLRSLKTYHF